MASWGSFDVPTKTNKRKNNQHYVHQVVCNKRGLKGDGNFCHICNKLIIIRSTERMLLTGYLESKIYILLGTS